MKKVYSLLIAISLYGAASAQIAALSPQVFASAGQYATSPTLTLSYTIGEPIVTTLTDIKLILTQGFQQPEDDFTISVPEFAGQYGVINVFPNPFTDMLNISVDTDKQHELYIYMYDMTGRQVQSQFLANHLPGQKQYSISTSGLAQGMYTLTLVSANGDFVKTVKITKAF